MAKDIGRQAGVLPTLAPRGVVRVTGFPIVGVVLEGEAIGHQLSIRDTNGLGNLGRFRSLAVGKS
jgi:hypothetical protein